jgi:hypothetical protein
MSRRPLVEEVEQLRPASPVSELDIQEKKVERPGV